MINKILVNRTNLVQRGNSWLPILSNQPEGAQRGLRHVGGLPVYHLYGHDTEAPDVHLLPVLLLIHNLGKNKSLMEKSFFCILDLYAICVFLICRSLTFECCTNYLIGYITYLKYNDVKYFKNPYLGCHPVRSA